MGGMTKFIGSIILEIHVFKISNTLMGRYYTKML